MTILWESQRSEPMFLSRMQGAKATIKLLATKNLSYKEGSGEKCYDYTPHNNKNHSYEIGGGAKATATLIATKKTIFLQRINGCGLTHMKGSGTKAMSHSSQQKNLYLWEGRRASGKGFVHRSSCCV